MIIGLPKEIKEDETRVALTPAGVEMLIGAGHKVLVERGAGAMIGFPDDEYASAGADLQDDPQEVYARAELICKVKEPLAREFGYLRAGQMLFTYLHLAAEREVAKVLMDQKVVALAYETVQLPDGSLPLLLPASEIAGRMTVQIGARLMENAFGGKGMLLGGIPGVAPAQVVIIGGGIVGTNAANIALGLGARVTILDINAQRLRYLDDLFERRAITVVSNPVSVAEHVADADLLVGAVLVPGARTPRLVTEEMVQRMDPGSVIVDVAIDQGGCIETANRVSTHSNPTYTRFNVIHYAVPNIPAAVGRTATMGLTNSTMPYIMELAEKGWERAIADNKALAKGMNVLNGAVVNKAVAEALGTSYQPL